MSSTAVPIFHIYESPSLKPFTKENMRLQINTPNIVHETFADDEAAIINLETGNYYSLNPTGTLIWSLIEQNTGIEEIAGAFIQDRENDGSRVTSLVNGFVEKLVKEELVIAIEDDTPHPDNADGSRSKKFDQEFIEPVIERFADMQELLLLDPIHDINEKGFPKMKAID